MSCVPQGVIGFGHFVSGRQEQAVVAMRRSVEMNPGFSSLHGWLTVPLAKLGRLDEARASAARMLALAPNFRIRRWLDAVGLVPEIAAEVLAAMRLAGLPE
jgi:hypothetical protein